MKFDAEKLNLYTKDELYLLFSSFFKEEMKKYSFLNLDINEYKNISISIIKKAINLFKLNQDNDFQKVLSNQFKKGIIVYIKQRIREDSNALSIISNFITINMKSDSNYKNIQNEFKKLDDFFAKFDYVLESDLCIDLIKENLIINNLLNSIDFSDVKFINDILYNGINKNGILPLFIENHCLINNISLDDEDKLNEDLYNYTYDKKYKSSLDIYLKQIHKPLLSVEEEQKYAYMALQGDEHAKNILIERNLRLVVSIAFKLLIM